MQKPDKQEVKDFIIEKVATDLQFSQDIVEAVVGWSYKKANEATKKHQEVELSGIGKLQLSQAKLKREIAKLEQILGYLQNEESDKKEEIKANVAYLKTKLNAG